MKRWWWWNRSGRCRRWGNVWICGMYVWSSSICSVVIVNVLVIFFPHFLPPESPHSIQNCGHKLKYLSVYFMSHPTPPSASQVQLCTRLWPSLSVKLCERYFAHLPDCILLGLVVYSKNIVDIQWNNITVRKSDILHFSPLQWNEYRRCFPHKVRPM